MKLGMITIMILLKNLCDYDYDYDYSKMCNRLQSITIIIVIRPNSVPSMDIVRQIVNTQLLVYSCVSALLYVLHIQGMATITSMKKALYLRNY